MKYSTKYIMLMLFTLTLTISQQLNAATPLSKCYEDKDLTTVQDLTVCDTRFDDTNNRDGSISPNETAIFYADITNNTDEVKVIDGITGIPGPEGDEQFFDLSAAMQLPVTITNNGAVTQVTQSDLINSTIRNVSIDPGKTLSVYFELPVIFEGTSTSKQIQYGVFFEDDAALPDQYGQQVCALSEQVVGDCAGILHDYATANVVSELGVNRETVKDSETITYVLKLQNQGKVSGNINFLNTLEDAEFSGATINNVVIYAENQGAITNPEQLRTGIDLKILKNQTLYVTFEVKLSDTAGGSTGSDMLIENYIDLSSKDTVLVNAKTNTVTTVLNKNLKVTATKTDNNDQVVNSGDVMDYVVEVTNKTPYDQEVFIVDEFTDTEFKDAEISNATINGNGTYDIQSGFDYNLLGGETITIEFSAKLTDSVPAKYDIVTNNVNIYSPDKSELYAKATDLTPYRPTPSRIKVEKNASNTSVMTGESMSYEIKISNIDQNAGEIYISDNMTDSEFRGAIIENFMIDGVASQEDIELGFNLPIAANQTITLTYDVTFPVYYDNAYMYNM